MWDITRFFYIWSYEVNQDLACQETQEAIPWQNIRCGAYLQTPSIYSLLKFPYTHNLHVIHYLAVRKDM